MLVTLRLCVLTPKCVACICWDHSFRRCYAYYIEHHTVAKLQTEMKTTEPNQIFNPVPLLMFYRTEPNQALEPTTMAVTLHAPSRMKRASHGRGSS